MSFIIKFVHFSTIEPREYEEERYMIHAAVGVHLKHVVHFLCEELLEVSFTAQQAKRSTNNLKDIT